MNLEVDVDEAGGANGRALPAAARRRKRGEGRANAERLSGLESRRLAAPVHLRIATVISPLHSKRGRRAAPLLYT